MIRTLSLATVALFGWAQSTPALITITVDENGHGDWDGSPLYPAATLSRDPGPGGLGSVLTYYLGNANPPYGQTIDPVVTGDLMILEQPGGALSDLIRFQPGNPFTFQPGTIFFYSDNSDGIDSLADVGFPTAFNANTLSVVESGVEGDFQMYHYVPSPGQPGYVDDPANPGHTYVAYNFISDVPEPSFGIYVTLTLALPMSRKRSRIN